MRARLAVPWDATVILASRAVLIGMPHTLRRADGRSHERPGEYRDRLVRRPDGWRIACREPTVYHEIGAGNLLRP